MSDLPVGEWPWDGERDTNEAEPLVDDMDAWDGAILPGHEVGKLVAELRRLLAALPGLGVAPPDCRDVRVTLAGASVDEAALRSLGVRAVARPADRTLHLLVADAAVLTA